MRNSEIIKKDLYYNNNIPFIFRDTGIDDFFFEDFNMKKDFDFVYSGSTNAVRKGLLNCFEHILKLVSIVSENKVLIECSNNLPNTISITGPSFHNKYNNFYWSVMPY